jgi:hypothetical protein
VNSGNGSVKICYLTSQDDTVFVPARKPTLLDVLANDPEDTTGTVNLEIVTPPLHGTAKVVGGKILYTSTEPLPPGGDTFTYGFLGTAVVTVRELNGFAGTYDGFIEDSGATPGAEAHQRSGFVRMTLTNTGTFTGTLYFAGQKLVPVVRKSFGNSNTTLEKTGDTARVAVRLPDTEITLRFQLNATGNITGTAESKDGSSTDFSSQFTLEAQRSQGLRAGLYTLHVQPDATLNSPLGTGIASVRIGTSGLVSTTGKMADGSVFACGSGLHADQTFALYAGLYNGTSVKRGSVRGSIGFASIALGDAQGTLKWFKPVRSTDTLFPNGFNLSRTAILARYNPPVSDSFALGFNAGKNNGLVTIDKGTFMAINQLFTLTPTNTTPMALPNTSKAVLKLNAKNGIYSGTFVHPTSKKVTPFSGALIQQNATGRGYFTGTPSTEAGLVNIEAN